MHDPFFKIYGDGSKREVVRDYASTVLTDCNYIIFHGYKLCVNAKSILDTINEEYGLGVKSRGVPLSEFARGIGGALENEGWKLFVLVLNIDGPALRYRVSQKFPRRFLAVFAIKSHLSRQLLCADKLSYFRRL